jgi:leucyl aminopeptidase
MKVLQVAVSGQGAIAEFETLGIPVWAGRPVPELPGGLPEQVGQVRAQGQIDPDRCERLGFDGAVGKSLVVRTAAGSPTVVLLGLGPRETPGLERWRLAAAALVKEAGAGRAAAFAVPADGIPPAADLAAALVEGAVLASYRFEHYRSAPRRDGLRRLVLVPRHGSGGPAEGDALAAALRSGLRRGTVGAEATMFARDLINRPAGDMTPDVLAQTLRLRLEGRPGVRVEVWDEDRIGAERLGALLGVSQGSAQPPRLVRATYRPPTPRSTGAADPPPAVILVGKGVTFDSGGLSLKTAEGMTRMKTDMTGAACVMSALSACADLELATPVSAIAPIAENMPGSRALRPGDVVTARNGATIEVLNTDAEGRLILADALCLAAEARPSAIVDVATLTGAAVVALGTSIGAIFGTEPALVERVRAAGSVAGEALWPLPLPEEYASHIDSDVADMKNMGKANQAGAIAAALLLAKFVGDAPWVHLDIAGPARAEEAFGYKTKGATGFSVRTLVELIRGYDPG